MSDPSKTVWLDILDDPYWGYFWADYLTGFSFSNTKDVWSFNPTPAITDSGSSCLVGPKSGIQTIERNVLKDVEIDFVDSDWGNVFSCSRYLKAGRLPNIQLKYGGYWFDVLPEDYVLDFDYDQCALCFNKQSEDMWILGDVFMRGWYHMHDYDSHR
jgi:hypothetical protein